MYTTLSHKGGTHLSTHNVKRAIKWLFLIGALVSHFHLSPFIARAQSTSYGSEAYGADVSVGPSLEPCVTEATSTNATVINPNDAWEEIVANAQPGTTLLFRAGTYQANDKLWLPPGAADGVITLKPYNCEAVTLYGSLRPLSYTVIAGLTLEAKGTSDNDYVMRIDSEYKGEYWGNITQVMIRNNSIRGGHIDAIRISDDTTHITLTGNHIDGGLTGHNIFVTSEKLIQRPNQILITNNQLTKNLSDLPAEDMFQVRDVGYVEFTYNTCTEGINMEQCIDIKTTTMPLLIAHNFFDGARLHKNGSGEDGADGCMVIHEGDGVADQHIVEHNFFKRCKGAAIRFASGSQDGMISSSIVRYNLFAQTSYSEGEIPVVRAQNVHFLNNTVVCGHLKLGNSQQTKLPMNTVIKNNIFYKTEIEDNTVLPASFYTCSHNLLFSTAGSGFSISGCTSTVASDPQFASATGGDFRLLSTSPALKAGETNGMLGALPLFQPAINLSFQLYLPVIYQAMNAPLEISCTP